MNKILVILSAVLLMMPAALAGGAGGNTGGSIGVEAFPLQVWQCGERAWRDDDVQPWRVTGEGECSDPAINDEAACLAVGICEDMDGNVIAAHENDEAECISHGVCSGHPNPKAQFDSSASCGNPANFVPNTFTQSNTWATSELFERNNNYAFEGETYEVNVLVMDKNKIDEAEVDVFFDWLVNGEDTGLSGGAFSLACQEIAVTEGDDITACNARLGQEYFDVFDESTMRMFSCYIEIPGSSVAYGEYELKVEATDYTGAQTVGIDETSVWFLNPMVGVAVTQVGPISTTVPGILDFKDLDGNLPRPGTSSYSKIQVKNIAEGGVILDMFILGEDWDSPDANQARCRQVDGQGVPSDPAVLLNQLNLGAFRYYVENGAYSSRDDAGNDDAAYDLNVVRDNTDPEGYLNIHKNLNTGFQEELFDEAEILQANSVDISGIQGAIADNVYLANLLYPGSTGMTLTFRLNLPEPCYGNFANANGFFIWGEAV